VIVWQALGKAGDVPTCIVNQTGKGRAVLLNFVLGSSFNVRWESGGLATPEPLVETPSDTASFFLSTFNAGGAERAFTFTGYKNESVPYFQGIRVQRWKNGNYQIVGFFKQTGTGDGAGSVLHDSAAFPVSPQRKASGRPYAPFPYVYDIRNGVTVGNGDWFVTRITPGSPSLYAFLPGPLPAMFIEMPKQARRGTPVTLKLSVPEARGLHSIKLRAVMPNGQPAVFWDRSILVSRNPEQVVLPLAWNDASGTWKITFSDLFSPETSQTMTLQVE